MSIETMLALILKGFLTTLSVFFLTLAGALPLGLFVYFGKVSGSVLLRVFTDTYISIARGTPLMLQLMVVYYGPNLVFGLTPPGNWRFSAVITAFVINYAAYFAEIYRGGINSVDAGQFEAASALGLNRRKAFFWVILPQMTRNALPAVTNEVITLVKDTSLASVIGTVEMFTRARQIAVAPHTPGMLSFAAAALFYYIFNSLVAFSMKQVEKSFDY